MVKIIQVLFISSVVLKENIAKIINTFKLMYILIKKDYKKAYKNTNNMYVFEF